MQRTPSLSENKLILLYTLRVIRHPASGGQLLEFFLRNDIMEYLDAKLALAELGDGGHIIQGYERDGEMIYLLTQRGREALRLFYTRIPQSRRERTHALAQEWRAQLKEERTYVAAYRRDFNDQYQVRLRLREQGNHVYGLSIRAIDKKQAQEMVKNWTKASAPLYRTVMRTLLQEPEDAGQLDNREVAIQIEAAQEEAEHLTRLSIARSMLRSGVAKEKVAQFTSLTMMDISEMSKRIEENRTL